MRKNRFSWGLTVLATCGILAVSACQTLSARSSEELDPVDEERAEQLENKQEAYVSFVRALLYKGERDIGKALEFLDRVVQLDPEAYQAHLEMGRIYLSSQRFGDALVAMERALAVNPECHEAFRIMARAHRMQGRLDEAAEAYRRATEVAPQVSNYFFQLSDLQLQLGDTEEAMRTLRRLTETDPRNSRAFRDLGEMQESSGDLEGARSSFLALTRLRSRDSLAHFDLGRVRWKLGEVGQALESFERAIFLSPDASPVDPSFQFSGFLGQTGNSESAINTLQDYTGDHPESWIAFFLLGRLEEEGSRLDEAGDAFKKTIELRPNLWGAHSGLGRVEWQSGRKETALESFEAAVSSGSPGVRLYALDAGYQFLRREGAWEEMIPFAERLAEVYRNLRRGQESYYIVIQDLALADFLADRTDEAVEHLTAICEATGAYPLSKLALRAITRSDESIDLEDEIDLSFSDEDTQNLFPWVGRATEDGENSIEVAAVRRFLEMAEDEALLHFFLGLFYGNQEQFEQAMPALSRSAELDPENKWIHYRLGEAYEQTKQYEKAAQSLRRSVEIDEDFDRAYNYLGYMYADQGIKLDEAKSLIERALELQPDNGAYLDSLGWVLFKQEKYDSALNYLEDAIRNWGEVDREDGDDPVIRDHLGDVYKQLGNTQQALYHWRRALQLDDITPELLETIRSKIKENESSAPSATPS